MSPGVGVAAMLAGALLASLSLPESGGHPLDPSSQEAGSSPRAARGREPAASLDSQRQFERANRLYQLDDLAGAETLYRQLLSRHPSSLAARYDLGNALFRQGRLGPALQQYLAVLRLAPRDDAARTNASAARRALAGSLTPEEREVIAAPAGGLAAWLAPGEAAWGAVAVFYAVAALARVALRVPRARRVATGGAAVILLAAAGFAAAWAWSRARAPEALVLGPIQARAGPGGTVVVGLPEGTAVQVRDVKDAWAFVSLPNGISGWVPRKDVGPIP